VLPEADVAAIRRFCEAHQPPDHVTSVRIELVEERGAVTLVERHASWRDEPDLEWSTTLVARWRFVAMSGLWTLYWPDRNGNWRQYADTEPTADIRVLLAAVDDDPSGIFWG
jgi:hypothetical protein